MTTRDADKAFEIIINGTTDRVPRDAVSFDEVARSRVSERRPRAPDQVHRHFP